MGSVRIDRLDHLVLTVADIDATVEFYTRVLGMKAVTFGTGAPPSPSVAARSMATRPVTSSSRRPAARRPAAPTCA